MRLTYSAYLLSVPGNINVLVQPSMISPEHDQLRSLLQFQKPIGIGNYSVHAGVDADSTWALKLGDDPPLHAQVCIDQSTRQFLRENTHHSLCWNIRTVSDTDRRKLTAYQMTQCSPLALHRLCNHFTPPILSYMALRRINTGPSVPAGSFSQI